MATKNLFLQTPSAGDIQDIYSEGAESISRLSLPSFPAPHTPPERTSTPAPSSNGSLPTRDDIVRRATELGIDPAVPLAIWGIESGSNFNSRDSYKGAVGGMQVMPGTFRQMMGTDEGQRDPWKNMEAGLRYIAYGQKVLGTKDPALLAAGYHAGYGRPELTRGEIPDTSDGLMNTRDYAAKVASKVGLGSGDNKAMNPADLQARLDAEEPGRYQVLSPEEARRLQLQSELDSEEPGRFQVLRPSEVDTLPDSALTSFMQQQPAGEQPSTGGILLESLKSGSINVASSIASAPEAVLRATEGALASLDRVGRALGLPEWMLERKYIGPNDIVAPLVRGKNFGTYRMAGANDIADMIKNAGKAVENPKQAQAIQQIAAQADQALTSALDTGDLSGAIGIISNPDAWAVAFGQAAPSLIAAMVGGVPLIAALEGGNAAAEVREFEEKGGKVGDIQAANAIMQTAAVNTLLEKLGLDAVMGRLPAPLRQRLIGETVQGLKGRLMRAGTGAVIGGVGETGTEALQTVNENLAKRNYNADQSLSEGVLLSAMGGGAAGASVGGVRGGLSGPQPAAQTPAQPAADTATPADTSAAPSGTTPAEPSGPITRAMQKATAPETVPGTEVQPEPVQAEQAPVQPDMPRVRLTAENGDLIEGVAEQMSQDGSARVLGDDGQLYVIGPDDGVTIETIAGQTQQPVTQETANDGQPIVDSVPVPDDSAPGSQDIAQPGADQPAGSALPEAPVSGSGTERAGAAIDAATVGENSTGAGPSADGQPALTEQQPIVRNDGQPFKSEAVARQAMKNRRLQGYEPVQVGQGWGLAPVAEQKAAKEKQPAMPRQDFDSTSGVGKVSAVKERYGDRYGVSWASTNIADAATMEEAAAIAKAVAESGADNIADMRKVAQQKPSPASTVREMTEEGRAKDGGPIMPGDKFRTLSGRETAPYPKQKSEKYASQWLIDNATTEAESRGDDFNARTFRATSIQKGGGLTTADREGMLMYLFGEQPQVVPSILKPLVREQQPAAEQTKAKSPKDTIAEQFKQETGVDIAKAGPILAGIEMRNNMRRNGNPAGSPATLDMEAEPFTPEQMRLLDQWEAMRNPSSKFLFHTTTPDRIQSIAENGLKPGAKQRFEGVSASGRLSFGANEATAAYYGGQGDVMLRVSKKHKFKDLGADMLAGDGAYTSSDTVPPEAIEAKVGGKWIPLKDAVGKLSSPAEKPAVKKEPSKPARKSNNKVFTDEAAEKARALLRSKLSQLNSGIDPEVLQAGITLAGWHIENGARTFAAYAKAMINDMGEGVKPYLKSWYLGVKFDPRSAGMEGMSTAAEVEQANVDNLADDGADAGETDTVVTPAGREIEVRYRVMDVADLVTSNLDDGRVNQDYPKELQPRDRSRLASQAQITEIASRLNPRLLGENPSTTDGAPIVSRDGVVESGNGRTIAIRRAYAEDMPSARAYRDWLAEQGYDVAGMKAPVLVRERVTEMSARELQDYTTESNERTTLAMSPTERAMSDAKNIGDIIGLYRGGDIPSAANRDFVRAFMETTVSQSDRGAMMDSDGILSQDGRRRIEAALLAAAYGNSDIVTDLFESSDSDIKAIGGALMDVAGVWAQMRSEAASGTISSSVDVTPNLMEAVAVVRRARGEGRPVVEFVNQDDFFAGGMDPVTVDFLKVFYRGDRFTRARGRDKVAEALADYVQQAQATQAGNNLFGEPEITGAEILRNTNERTRRQEGQGQEQQDIFAGTRTDDADTREPGREGQRPQSETPDETAPENGGRVNAPGSRQRVERDSEGEQATQSVVPEADDNDTGRTARVAGRAGQDADQQQRAGQRDQRLPDDGPATGGERSDQPVYRSDGQLQTESGATGSAERAGSRGDSVEGSAVEQERAEAVIDDAAAPGADDLAERLAAQKKASNVKTKWGDKASIDAALPLLLPEQRDDVLKAEKRLANNNGILFTNGTGTGKTATGLGVVKRHINDGKDNIIVVVPSDKIAFDWVEFAGMMGVDLKQLDDTTSNGKTGPVITTYANFGQNETLAKRDWDLVVADESHYLSSNEDGKDTAALEQLRALTGHHNGFFNWVRQRFPKEWKSYSDAMRARSQANGNPDIGPDRYATLEQAEQKAREKWMPIEERERARWDARWASQQGLPKTVFLSATPFAYTKSTDYAEGYLFHYVEPAQLKGSEGQGGGYNSGSPRDRFMMQQFGYRMRYNKLTAPEAGVDSQLMEQQFNEWLKSTGALSGRRLEVPFDYDRKFVLVDDAVGTKIDEGLKFLREAEDGKYRQVYDAVMSQFDYQRRMYLLESMKARAAVPIIREHLSRGRKVVVFHDFNKGGGFDPFQSALREIGDPDVKSLASEVLKMPMFNLDFSGLFSPIETMTQAFPDALFFNGTVKKAKRRANADLFNDDDSGRDLIVVQSDAGREGVSLHDTTGNHQRVEINLGMPVKPVAATQIEGRTYRTGQASDAVFRYLTTGTAWEASAFASKIAERASTAENLALGNEARGLRDAFIDAYQNADTFPASDADGKGGKDHDRNLSAAMSASPFERAKTFYWAQQKNTKRRGQREGVDYFATPEPVGFKMVEWANVQPNDRALEPSAGHGAIARFFPEQADVTMVEPSYELSQRAALANGNARIVNDTFEQLHINNKYDAIVMNPPYGSGGKTSTEHLAKAAKHLRNGGRLVALIPRGGQADKRLDAFLESEDAADLYTVARVNMPSVTFERAGTSVNTQILVLEKHTNPEDAASINERWIDLSGAESINELFDRLENVGLPPRQQTSAPEPKVEIVEHTTGKGKVLRGVIRTDLTKDEAQAIDRFTFRKKNAEGQSGWFIRAKHLDDGPKYSVAPQTETAAFKRWFGDSKVVDADGNPLVVYHGTRHSFDEFERYGRKGRNRLHYFTDDPTVASEYAGGIQYGSPNVMPSYVSLQKPFMFDAGGEQWGSLPLDLFPEEIAQHFDERNILRGRTGQVPRIGFTEVIRGALAAGYDGVIVDNIRDGGGPYGEQNPSKVVVANRPEQIKSATGNIGTFDPANPDIRYSVADSAQLRQALTGGDLGALVGRIIKRSQVVLHDTVSTVPVDHMPTGVQAVSTPDGKIHLVADALTAQSARPVLLHEAFHQGGESLIGSKAWGDLLKRLGAIHRQARQSSGRARQFYDDARRSVALAQRAGVEMNEDLTAEEFGAYTIEHYDKAPAAFRKWVDDVVGALKAWLLRRFGIQAGAVTPAQLRALAVAALRNEAAPTGGDRFSVAPPTNSPAFRRWFGGSKVVDADGKPMVVYHGSDSGMAKFRVPAFFTKDMDGAQWYAIQRSDGDEGVITEAYLSIKKPFDMRTAESYEVFFDIARKAGVKVEGNYMDGTFYAPEIADNSEYEGTNPVDLIYIPAVQEALEKQGYDGLLLNDQLSSSEIETWVALRPEQIKSATGNAGTFDPENADIRYSLKPSEHFKDLSDKQKGFLNKIGPERLPQRLSDRWRQLTDSLGLRIRQAGVDRYAALLRNDKALYGEDTLEGSIASSAWVLARMSHSAGGAMSAMLNNGRIYLDPDEKVIDVREGTKGLRTVLQQLGTPQEIDRFMAWIAANRARKLYADGRENLFTEDEIEAGVKLSTGKTEDGKNRALMYSKAWRDFQQYRDDVLAIAEQSGTISKEQRETWSEEFYVPFYRVLDEESLGGPSSSSGLSRQQAYKRLKGGKQNLNDLLENTLLNFHHLIQTALKNQAARQAVDNAVALEIAEPTTESMRDKKLSTFVMEDGQKRWYDISDPLTFKALAALNSTGLNTPLMKAGRAFKRLFTNMTTITPQFLIANTLRDSLSAMATSPTSAVPFKNAVKGAAVYGNADNRAKMIASGGSFSFGHVYGQNADEIKASLKGTLRDARLLNNPAMIPSALMTAWRKWNQVTDFAENINRAGIWDRNLSKGKLKAAFEARDLMDFSAHGDALTVRIMTDLVPFLNARIQGLDKLYRSGFKPGAKVMTGKGTKSDKLAFARFAVVTGALSVLSVLLYLNNMDDEEYRNLEDWQRDTYWFLRVGEAAFFIPKPFEVGAIATLAERAVEQFADPKVAGKKFAERLGHMLTDTFSLDLPQIIKPAYELSANRNTFTGRPIEDMGMQRLSPSLRVRPNTTRLSEGASRAMETVVGDSALSPVQIDHLIGAYLGQVGAGTAALADTLWRRAMGEQLPARRWDEYQPIRRFYRDLGTPAPYTRYATDFYNALKEADKAYANVQHLIKYQEFEKAGELQQKEGDKLAIRPFLNRVQRDLSKINAEMRQVQIDKEMSGEEKRVQLERLRSLKNMITEEIGKELENERIRARDAQQERRP